MSIKVNIILVVKIVIVELKFIAFVDNKIYILSTMIRFKLWTNLYTFFIRKVFLSDLAVLYNKFCHILKISSVL